MAAFRIAAAQYPIEWLGDFADFERKLTLWVSDAARGGARLVLFPEYGGMELASLAGRDIAGDLAQSIASLQPLLPRVHELHRALAREHNIYICGGTLPVAQGDGRYCNTAHFYAPSSEVGIQQKRIMTRFERERWHIAPGAGLSVFDTALGKIGIAICYDAEFPLLVRKLAEAGAQVILVPSCTDSLAGYHRVRVSCAARALENQCYVVQAPTIGAADWSPAIDRNVGAAGVFGPPDGAFPDDGVVAMGTLNEPGLVFAQIDLALVADVRAAGHVFNHRHWDEQGAVVGEDVAPVMLR